MSTTQRIILLAGALLVLLMLLFPPWTAYVAEYSGHSTRFAGFHFILQSNQYTINSTQLLLQIVAVGFITALIYEAAKPST